ncbi:malonyl-ACP O-methyltransferase BioC [Exilibacterium tricleocarpae]|uniref:Malonyl-[acyl-carrier protein] O-methyltransferase n=1 Tax=Exilibacterium tricleocarpae TaxID=2591008 RepID=A0A545T3T1_9GAMM|nr:malonyl-ACP O-methyltransferase BioC [Exilibacterium tricleocarpae]
MVLLHGWGSDSRVFEPLLAHLDDKIDILLVDIPGFAGDHAVGNDGLESLLQGLRQKLPRRCVLLGWSLGGMLACRYAHRYPQRVAGVITLASNLCFVARPGWPSAMPNDVFQTFAEDFRRRPAVTLQRFDGLQARGDRRERAVLKWLRGYRRAGGAQPDPRWRAALALLAGLDNRKAFADLKPPGLHLLGDRDALVPAAAAAAMAQLNPVQTVKCLAGCGHALCLAEPQQLAAEVEAFLQRLAPVEGGDAGARLDKTKVAASFSRAAATYDAAAVLQRQVGERLLQLLQGEGHLQAINRSDATLLDVGCGTGHFTRALAGQVPAARVLGLDIAEGMLAFARRGTPPERGPVHWVGGDAECLPLAAGSIAGIFSSLAIQWCQHPGRLFEQWRRVLKPGGWLAVATLGPATLHELRCAWSRVDNYTHVNRFAPREQIEQALSDAGFSAIQWQCETRVMHYGDVRELTRELKALGAHNVNAGQRAGLTGRRRLRQFTAAYEQFRCGHTLPASYEVYYVLAR